MTEQTILAGRYRLESLLGRGGMGEVWRAADDRLGRPVAVKLLAVPPGGRAAATAVERFRREARIAARLRHPGIAVVHDFGEDGGRLFLVMELVDGRDLNAVVADHPAGLPPERAAALAARIAAALRAAHEQGVVHRDIKPANVMVNDRDEITVLDFGIARYADAVTDLTGSAVIGTPAFMAPEQFDKDAAIDGRTDLYALGALLYVLLTGETPFAADSIPSLLREVMFGPPPSPRERNPDVPAGLDALVRDLLAKNPADRPADAAEVIARLTGPSSEPRPARSPDTGTSDAAPDERLTFENIALSLISALLLFAVVGGLPVYYIVGDLNPGGFIDEGAFDKTPTCASVTPRELSGIPVKVTEEDTWHACRWQVEDGKYSWYVSLTVHRFAREGYSSGPGRARKSLDQDRRNSVGAWSAAIGDGGYHSLHWAGRSWRTEFSVSNLLVTVEIRNSSARDEDRKEFQKRGVSLAQEVAKKLEPMA